VDISLQILLLLAVPILLARGLGDLSARLGFPIVLGELLAGVVASPTLLDVLHLSWFSAPVSVAGAPISVAAALKVLADLGVVVLMFLAGVETDVVLMRRTVGPALSAACGGVILPLAAGTAAARAAGLGWPEAVFVSTVLTATSVSITAQTLMNLGELRSPAGSTILGAAVIDDILGLVVLSFVIALEPRSHATAGLGWGGIGMTLARMAAFLLVAVGLGPRVVQWAFRRAKKLAGQHVVLGVALALAFLFAFLADALGGMAAITGAYLAGVLVGFTPAQEEVSGEIRSLSHSFLGPLFFVSIGLEINARTLGGHWAFFLTLLIVAVGGKVLGCGLGAWLSRMSSRDSLIVGIGMVPRGEVGLITATIGWTSALIAPRVFSLLVVLVLITTLLTPIMLRIPFRQSKLEPSSPSEATLPEF
jgi:Kef-type K+ transport system membrane component KefB